ncbi:uncharacterized protein ACNS7B_004253 [Menidia menidia]
MESVREAWSCPAPSQTAVTARPPPNTRGTSDSQSRYHGDGVRYRAKLIGMDTVPGAQGQKMCLDCMMKLKGFEAAARKQGKHKLRIWLKICSSGLKIVDERSGIVLHDHDRSKISSLTKDASDPRALAYIYQHEEAFVLFYIKTANQADPVLLDIKEVCQKVEQETPNTLAETQTVPLVHLNHSSPPPAMGEALNDVFSPRPSTFSEQSNQCSSNELMEVFSSRLEDPLSPTQNTVTSPSESPLQMFSTAQILSMFPAQPVGGAPYFPTPHCPSTVPWGQQGPWGNQWGGETPTMAGNAPVWSQTTIPATPVGVQPQAHATENPPLGFVVGGSTVGCPAMPPSFHGYTIPLNSAHTSMGATGELDKSLL